MSNAVWGGLFFCALSLWLLVHTLKNIIKYEPSKRWPHVIGEVTACDAIQLVPGQGQQRDLIVEYAYEVDGEAYIGSSIALYTLSVQESRELEKKLKVNPRAAIFYNPKHPEESLLIVGGRKDKPYNDFIMALIGLAVRMFLIWGGYSGVLHDH
jgi:hypothetical protein